MMVCTQCGFQNENEDAFCGSCGAFLEWAGETVESGGVSPEARAILETPAPELEPTPAPSAEPEPEPAPDTPAAATALFPPGPTSPFRGEEPPAPPAEPALEAAPEAAPEPKQPAPVAAVPKPDGKSKPEAGKPAAAEAGTGAGAVSLPRPPETAEPAPAAKTAEAAEPAAAAKADGPATVESRPRGPAVVTGTPTQTPAARARAQAPAAPPARPPAQTPPAAPTRTPGQSPAARTPGATPPRGPVARRPDAVKPAGAKPRPVPTKPPPRREIHAGDLICNQCQEGNDPNRKFCRRCGASLVEAKEAVVIPPPPVPWWKRPFVHPQPQVVAAGERPMRRGGSSARRDLRSRLSQVRRVTALLAVLGLGVGFIGPWRSNVTRLFRGAKEKVVPKLTPVTPVSAEASSSLAGHPPTMAIDRAKGNDNYWAEGAKGDGVGQKLIVNFKPAIRLGRIGFTLGASTKPEDFVTEPRPRTVRLHFPDGSTKDLQLKDIAEFQDYAVDAKDVGRLEIEILTVYPSTQGKTDCWISEVEFFERT